MSHGRDTSPKPYGVVAEFNSPEELLKAARSAKDKGYSKMEGYSPIPVHGLLDVIGKEDNRLGWLVFGAGVTGAAAGLILQVYTSTGFKFVTGIAWLDSWIQNTGLNGYQHN
ncbi:MAG: DUF3341 domain-containing protein, partial [Fimbriimonadaceae bacterium]|nr:DUF3341 domain-containing protein [Fimbriimonadaceae bacterium]